MNSSILFNAQHAPVGAFASFTLGYPGPSGGLGLELGGPANQNVFIGLEAADSEDFYALPFFSEIEDESRRFDVEATGGTRGCRIHAIGADKIQREFGAAVDRWQAGDLSFAIYSPVKSVPDPESKATLAALKSALVPAVFVEIMVDNTQAKKSRKLCFGYQGTDPYSAMRRLDDVAKGKFTGIGQGLHSAIVSDNKGVYSGLGFTAEKCLRPHHPQNLSSGLGGVGMLMVDVPAGKKRRFRFAVCFHRAGIVTSGMPCHYAYSRWFPTIETVADYALQHWSEQKQLAENYDRALLKAKLSPSRHFQLCQAIRSYYGSTEYLYQGEQAFWAVNEGEYRMLNTFDLTVDHLFFEMAHNPWVVRNQLDWFVKRYAYRDGVRLPGDKREYPGGISFTHDMGVANQIAHPGHSAYELGALDGCFSHMSHEQLVNWVLCAVTYWRGSGDDRWMQGKLTIFRACLRSLVARDHPDPKQRNGVMGTDAARCLGGAEITTYDSLDTSLGQARNNLYLAVKTWAAYLGLAEVFAAKHIQREQNRARSQARRCADTVIAHRTADGSIPAVMEGNNSSRIIPAIEGLVFPAVWQLKEALAENGPFADLRQALCDHLKTVLVPGICRFSNGAWKLSSTNDNSWLSKTYLCQFVAEKVLGLAPCETADNAHANWLRDADNAYYAWSDQIVAGKARGSKYYPRGVTAWLWV